MNYEVCKKFTSEIDPSVSFTLRKFSHGTRSRLRLELLPALDKIQAVADAMAARLEEMGEIEEGKELSPKQVTALEFAQRCQAEIESINGTEVDPKYLHACLVKVEGLTIQIGDTPIASEGAKNPAFALTAYNLMEYGPEDIVKEIIEACKSLSKLGEGRKENLSSPTTSGAVVDGQTSDTIAPSAGASATGGLEIVRGTSHNT